MTNHTDLAPVTTALAIAAIAYGRAPRQVGGRINRRVVCGDGFMVSLQASPRHYAADTSDEAPYWSMESLDAYEPLVDYDGSGVWPWVPSEVCAGLLDAHGGAVGWEDPA